MTQTTEQAGPESPRPDRPSVRRGLVWRVLTILVIVLAAIAVAHYLKSPLRRGTDESGSATAPAGSATDPFASPAESGRPPGQHEEQPEVTGLRRTLAGLLMAAAEEGGPYENPANKDPEARREFIASLFGLPLDHPRGDLPPDLVPAGGQMLMVLASPAGDGSRMVLIRMPSDVHRALADVYRQYKAAGWQAVGEGGPEASKADDGWLVRFAKAGRYRIVFARPRQTVDETLLAVYDTP
jgi:hypothetical protein